MCVACDAARERAEAARTLQEACQGQTITALRTFYKPIQDDSFAELLRKLADKD